MYSKNIINIIKSSDQMAIKPATSLLVNNFYLGEKVFQAELL
jgi:hypothetical protein